MKKIISFVLFIILIVSCKNETKKNENQDVKTSVLPTPVKKEQERKIITGMVEAQIDGQPFNMNTFDQKLTTDVTFLDNGIQFRINDVNKKSVLVNMYAPDLLKHIPITISQQTSALEIEEAYKVKTQSRLEVVIPSEQPMQGDSKVLYTGTVSLEELSENKLVVTFSGNGFSSGSTLKKELFPMEGKIVLDNFNVYDFRTNNMN